MPGLVRPIGLGIGLSALLACGQPERELRVGHAVPVGDQSRVLVNVARGMLDSTALPRLTIVPWEVVPTNAEGSETGQAERFASDPRVVAVVGHAGSKSTLLASPIYGAAGVPVIVPTATSRLLRDTLRRFLDHLGEQMHAEREVRRPKQRTAGVPHEGLDQRRGVVAVELRVVGVRLFGAQRCGHGSALLFMARARVGER